MFYIESIFKHRHWYSLRKLCCSFRGWGIQTNVSLIQGDWTKKPKDKGKFAIFCPWSKSAANKRAHGYMKGRSPRAEAYSSKAREWACSLTRLCDRTHRKSGFRRQTAGKHPLTHRWQNHLSGEGWLPNLCPWTNYLPSPYNMTELQTSPHLS